VRGRAAHTATLLGDGRVLIVGGCTPDGCTTAEGSPGTEYYVPGLGFTAGPELVQPRQGHSATLLSDGRVLIDGGWAREGTQPLDSAEIYDPLTGRFELVGPMTMGRGGHTAIALPDRRVLIVGGGSDRTATELFDPERDTFMPAAPMPDGRVLVLGGTPDDRELLRSTEIYDPQTG
jgi:hypothetical protein